MFIKGEEDLVHFYFPTIENSSKIFGVYDNTVMIYVRDSFDYNDSGVTGTLMSQPLGYWTSKKIW